MLAREFECASGVRSRTGAVTTCGERFCPAQMPTRRPSCHVVGFVKLPREGKMLVGPPALANDVREQAKPQARVSVARRSYGIEPVGERRDAFIQSRKRR